MEKDLMTPRYEVVADWPMNVVFTIGEIVVNPLWHYFSLGHKEWHMKDLPHLFKSLSWWEKRTVEEMPEYLKRIIIRGSFHPGIKIGDVIKVKWDWDYFDKEKYPEVKMLCFTYGGEYYHDEYCFLPATLTEYQSYLKSKK